MVLVDPGCSAGPRTSRFARSQTVNNNGLGRPDLFNRTDGAQDFIATIYYGDGSGSYRMPVHLGAQASTMMDMAILIGENRPDVHGHNIPAGVRQGSVVIESAKGESQWMTLVVSSGVYNPLRGTCTVNCITCYGYSGFCVVANPFAVPVTSTTPLHANATYSDGNVHDYTSSSSWRSDNTSVATVGTSTGVVTGQAPGSLNAYATFPSLIVTTGQICSGGTPVCPTGTPSPGSPGNVLVVSQSPPPPPTVNMSSGDTDQITVTIYGTAGLGVNTSFVGTSAASNPNSNCTGSLNIPGHAGTIGSGGSVGVASNITVSNPNGCGSPSGILNVTAAANGLNSSNRTTYDVPPQILLQMMYAEANGQNDSCRESLGLVFRNRMGDCTYFSCVSSYQVAIPGQASYNTSITTGVENFLDDSVAVWTSALGDFTGGSGCFWSPTTTQWQAVQSALSSGTTTFPANTGDPGCYKSVSGYGPQIIYDSSVGTSTRGGSYAGAPAFLFERKRNITGTVPPAAIQLN